jgi:integrase
MISQPARRQRRKTMTDRMVAALPKRRKRYPVPDPELGGHYIRVMPTGANVYVAVARDPYGKQVWAKIDTADKLSIEKAREKAREAIQRIKAGLPAVEPPKPKPDAFKSVAENWLKRHVIAKKLRTRAEIERVLAKYVYPLWGDRDFTGLRRADIASLLDHVQDHHGDRQADYVLAIVRQIANWYSTRHDDYLSPFTRGMRRAAPGKRERVLDDDELRAVWRACEEANDAFSRFVRLLLLTAQRRGALAHMRWADLDDNIWRIPSEAREKGNAGDLRLPPMALEITRAQPRLASNPYVFAGRSDGPINGFSKAKAALDKRSGVTDWALHDCRRTARSLLSRASVSSEHAERVMGHVIPGVEGVYDRHAYFEEKAVALAKLAALIERIVNPPEGDVVVPMRPRAAVQP